MSECLRRFFRSLSFLFVFNSSLDKHRLILTSPSLLYLYTATVALLKWPMQAAIRYRSFTVKRRWARAAAPTQCRLRAPLAPRAPLSRRERAYCAVCSTQQQQQQEARITPLQCKKFTPRARAICYIRGVLSFLFLLFCCLNIHEQQTKRQERDSCLEN